MKEYQDAFGKALLDYYEGKEAQIIIERDDGNIDISGEPGIYFRDFELWDEFEKKAMSLVSGRVLDIGSGAGRHALFLQDQGLEVVAIDNSPMAIDVIRHRGVKQAIVLPVTKVSSKLGCFDTIIMMGNNFGLVSNKKRAGWLFHRFHSITTPQAKIIATSLDPSTTEDTIHLTYQARNRKRGRYPGQVRIRVRYRTYTSPWFDYLLASPAEMEELIADTGWVMSGIIPSDGAVYAAVIQKTGSHR